MTWNADEILIPASPEAVARFAGDPALRPFSYWVKSLADYPWYSPDHQHQLPEQGLIVVRPVREAESGSHSWYSEPTLDWASLSSRPQPSELLDGTVAQRLSDYLNEEGVPPLSFRQFLCRLAAQIGSPVLYYAGSMWGGDIDSEYCLLYSPREILMLTKSQLGGSELGAEDALRAGLAAIGIQLPTGFFALHTRSFPWHAHHLSAETTLPWCSFS